MIEIKKLPKGAIFDIDLIDDPIIETPVPHRHEFFEIFWVLEGKGYQSIDFNEYSMLPGKVFFIAPGQVHDVRTVPTKLCSISFNPEFINAESQSQLPIDRLFLQNRCAKPFLLLDKQGEKDIRALIDIMIVELNSEMPDKDLMSTLLLAFLRYMMRYLDDQEDCTSNADLRMVKLLKLIDDNFKVRKDVTYYAEQLSMTGKRLNELSKEQFSKTVTQLLHDKVIVEARRELAFTHKSIKTISMELGYKETSYFCRFFKRLSGQSPQSFRQEWVQ